MNNDHSGAVWVIGILLVVAVAMSSPFWGGVFHAYVTGEAPSGQSGSVTAPGSGLMMTAGAFLLVIMLAGVAQISPGAGEFAVVLLLGLWMLFLVNHTALVSGFLGHFIPARQGG